MPEERITINSSFRVILSESEESSDTYDAKFVICDFKPNKNKVALNPNTIDKWLDSLVTKPLVGKVIKKYNGDEDFSSHNMKVTKKKDDNGEEYYDVEFDTSAFGSFYEISVEEIDGVDHIVASAKVWKRFTKASEVFRRRIEEEEVINTSWEIEALEFHYEIIDGENVKIIDLGNFLGHCLLGSGVTPAYDSSKLLNIASYQGEGESELELASALVEDIEQTGETPKENGKKEEEGLKVKKVIKSALSMSDLAQKLNDLLNPKGYSSSPYYSIWNIYPEEHQVLCKDWDKTDEELMVFKYTVGEDDEVTLGEGVQTKLSKVLSEFMDTEITIQLDKTVKLISEKELTIKGLEKDIKEKDIEISNLKDEVESKVGDITTLGETVSNLEIEVSNLKPFKEQVDAIEAAKREKELAEERKQFKNMALSSKYITEEDIETSEKIKKMIDDLDEKGIKLLIAERVLSKIRGSESNEEDESNDGNDGSTIETAQSNDGSTVRTDLSAENDDKMLSATDIVRLILK